MNRTQTEANVRKSLLRRGIIPLIENGDSLSAILHHLILNVEAQADKMLAAIFFYNPTSEELCVGAAPHLQPSYQKAVNGFKSGPQQPACGSAVFKGERVISHDVRQDPLWKDLLPYAKGAGFCSVWSQPIFSDDANVLGTLAFYFPEPKSPDTSDVVVMEAVAELAAMAIQSRRDEFMAMSQFRKAE